MAVTHIQRRDALSHRCGPRTWTRCWSATSTTCATCPGSPDPTRRCWFRRRPAGAAGHRRPLPHQAAPGPRSADGHRTGLRPAAGQSAAAARAARIGFEGHVVTVDAFDALGAQLTDGARLVRASGTVEALREVKDAGEVALLRLACEAADAALADLIEHGGLRPGRTERQGTQRPGGADARPRSRRPVVRDDRRRRPNSAVPHHRPTDAVLGPAISSRSTSARWSAATTPT